MKNTMLILTLALTASSFQTANACSIKCEQKGTPSVAAMMGAVAGSVVFFNNRDYGTWVRECQVVSANGDVFYKEKISGAEVTGVGMTEQGASHQPGDNLTKKYAKKASQQDIRLVTVLNQCNQVEVQD